MPRSRGRFEVAPRREITLSDGARLAVMKLRHSAAELVERTLELIARSPEVGIPLYSPLQAFRVLTVSPGLKLVYAFTNRRVFVSSVHAAQAMTVDRTERFGSIVLAAGAGRCCGQPEQLFPLGEGPAIVSSIRSLLVAPVHAMVLVIGYEARRIRRLLTKMGSPREAESSGIDRLTLAYNADYRGPMSRSLQVGLKVLDPGLEGVLLGLGNRPLVRPSTIRTLMRAFLRERPRAVRPCFHSQPGHPVLIDPTLVGELLSMPSGGSARDVLARCSDVLDLCVDDPGVVKSVREICAE